MATTVPDLMPTVDLGPHRVSRLIVGSNPFSGNSHVSAALSAEMRDFHSNQRLLESLARCEKWGITAFQSRGDSHMIRLYNEHRLAGGRLRWIVQTASEITDLRANVSQIVRAGAVAIYLHGTRTDALWSQGRFNEVPHCLRVIREAGVLVGLGTHIPDVVAYAEEHAWDLDFYMACLYNLSRVERDSALVSGAPPPEEQFIHSDRDAMCAAIRATPKPVLAFKILAASRLSRSQDDLEGAFRYAFANIKPSDAVVVGMFCKYGDQVGQNARLALRYGRLAGAPVG
jgi:hypothetical protein